MKGLNGRQKEAGMRIFVDAGALKWALPLFCCDQADGSPAIKHRHKSSRSV
jgi:hypothetical protein